MATTHEKITVNLIEKASTALAAAAARERHTRTDTLNRALQVYDFITAQIGDGADIIIRKEGQQDYRLKLM